MKIFYTGDLSEGSTAAMRVGAMQELGHEVIPFDNVHHCGRSRITGALCFRFPGGPWARRLNVDFVEAVSKSKPQLIWIDKGVLLRSSSLRKARAASRGRIVHYNPDDPFGENQTGWNVFLSALPDYDLHLVMRDVNVSEYQKAGAHSVRRWQWAYDPTTHRPHAITPNDRQGLGGPIGFIGTYEPERAASIAALASSGLPVRIWGNGWDQYRNAPPLMKIEGRGLINEQYAISLCSFDISLGFLRKANRDLSTQRSVEIPATGSFMLAERTDEHRGLFVEGKEAEFFGSDQELCDKARYYLSHPSERAAIAAAGLNRCVTGGYSYQDRLREAIGYAFE